MPFTKFICMGSFFCIINFITVVSIQTTDNLRRILPTTLKIREGQDMQLRLTKILNEEVSCYVKTPTHVSHNLKINSNINKISYWTENGECGVLVKNVTKDDEGRWRLTSKNENRTLVDIADVRVLDKLTLTENEISIFSGLEYTLNLADNAKYCTVKHPHNNEEISMMDDCKVEINRPTTADSGNWTAKFNVKGQIEEVLRITHVNVFYEHVIVGYEVSNDSKSLHIFCNLKYHNESLELCKFIKPDINETHLQMSDGLRKGRYGYYGSGLSRGDCGLTIESPLDDEYGKWQCLINTVGKPLFGSYIQVFKNNFERSPVQPDISPVTTIITTVGEAVTLECFANVPLSYCWFLGPDGTIITPPSVFAVVEKSPKSYRNAREGIGNGKCSVQILSTKTMHSGNWICHMGPSTPGIELTAVINVRLSETYLAALNKHLAVEKYGTAVTLACRTVPRNMALQYCRFYSPDNIGIHINEKITEKSPLLIGDTYYWFNGISTSLGDCGLVIGQVSHSHIGNWTCGARLESDKANKEEFDTIHVYLADEMNYDNDTMMVAGLGIITGVLIMLITLALSVLFAVRRLKNGRSSPQGNDENSGNNNSDIIELNSLCSGSSSSGSVNSQLSLMT